jgi:hypothetical protein
MRCLLLDCRADRGKGAYTMSNERAVKRYLPFSEGPRSCAGMSLAKINLTATLATLLGNFTFQLAEEVSMPAPLSCFLFSLPLLCSWDGQMFSLEQLYMPCRQVSFC